MKSLAMKESIKIHAWEREKFYYFFLLNAIIDIWEKLTRGNYREGETLPLFQKLIFLSQF